MIQGFVERSEDAQAAAEKITAIELNVTKKTLYVGESATLKVTKVNPVKGSKAVIWKTTNKKIATVNAKGKVTAKKKGTVKITVVSKKNKKVKAVCKITVKVKKKENATIVPFKTPSAVFYTENPKETPTPSFGTTVPKNTERPGSNMARE